VGGVGCGPFIDKIERAIVITLNYYGTPVYTIIAHGGYNASMEDRKQIAINLAFQYVYMLSMKPGYF